MRGDEFRAIRERRLDLDLQNHFGHAVHHLAARKERGSMTHEIGYGATVARALDDRRREVCDGLGIVELYAAREAPLRDERRGEEQQLVLLSRGEFHDGPVASAMVEVAASGVPDSG